MIHSNIPKSVVMILAIAVITLSYESAGKPRGCEDDPPHPSCNPDDAGEVAEYRVDFEMTLPLDPDDPAGGPFTLDGDNIGELWVEKGKGRIGGRNLEGSFTHLSFFNEALRNEGKGCFGVDDLSNFSIDFSPQTTVAKQKGKGDGAQSSFWFRGTTFDVSNKDVLYLLFMTGTIEGDMPPTGTDTTIMTMTDWEVKLENEGAGVKSMSCLGEGSDDPFAVEIRLKLVPPA